MFCPRFIFYFLVLSVTISKPPLMMSSSANRPRSIYQYSNMAPRLSGQTSIFGVVFFVFESLLGTERQKKLKKNYNFDPKTSEPR